VGLASQQKAILGRILSPSQHYASPPSSFDSTSSTEAFRFRTILTPPAVAGFVVHSVLITSTTLKLGSLVQLWSIDPCYRVLPRCASTVVYRGRGQFAWSSTSLFHTRRDTLKRLHVDYHWHWQGTYYFHTTQLDKAVNVNS